MDDKTRIVALEGALKGLLEFEPSAVFVRGGCAPTEEEHLAMLHRARIRKARQALAPGGNGGKGQSRHADEYDVICGTDLQEIRSNLAKMHMHAVAVINAWVHGGGYLPDSFAALQQALLSLQVQEHFRKVYGFLHTTDQPHPTEPDRPEGECPHEFLGNTRGDSCMLCLRSKGHPIHIHGTPQDKEGE